ncbi:MAG: LuxR C-terminal-related transcriptional regulator [Burkholderiales bacterium]
MTFARTKIQPPRPRASFVERGSLHDRLAHALATRRVVLLCAPAGYGKTMLLAQEAARLPAGTALAWISADAGDDVQRLVECMLAALEPFDPPWRTAPDGLLARVGRSPEEDLAVAADIINALDACEAPHGVIAFDDLHRVDDPGFFAFLDLLVERMSPRWTLALSSRAEPPVSLARLRVSDELAEFRQLELQFARDDARRMASEAGVDPALADRLFDRTHGWPAGLRIAIGALRADDGRAASPQAVERALRAGNRPLFDFLLTEVLGDLTPELADFLQRVSVLTELEARRCAEVSGIPTAAAHLDAIERLGLFVEVLDAPVRTLRLHDLLRDALQQRLALERPQLLHELRLRAADTEPDPVRRVGLRLDAEDYARAARDVYEHVPPMVATTGTATARNLVERFPADFRERSPELALVQGLVAWVHWDFKTMLAAFERAEAGFLAADDAPRALYARAYRATALMAHGRIADADAALASMRGATLTDETRIVALNSEAWLAIDTGRLRAVAPLVDEMVSLLTTVDRLELWYHTTPPNRLPGLPGIRQPLLRHAQALLQVAGDSSLSIRALAIVSQAWCALFQGRVGDAAQLLDRAREDANWTGHAGAVVGHTMALSSFLEAVKGNVAKAIEIARERLCRLGPGYGSWGRYLMLLLVARIASIGEDAQALREALAQMNEALMQGAFDALPAGLPPHAELAWLEGRAHDAIAMWRDALRREESIDLYGQASETRVRLARALARQGDLAEAAHVLAPVFARAREEEGPGGALFAGGALAELAAADWRGSLDEARIALLRAWSQGLSPVCALLRTGDLEPASAAGALSPRELEVLRRIAAGDSNKLIARAFDLSPHTVKRHVANILGKLGVDTRGQAAAWYRSHAA